jgi:8-oxo-dGTP pyrophosphatase MutT (NUDIX family)
MPTLKRRAARAVVIDPQDRVLLLKARDPADPSVREWWELPGGGIEGDETSEEAAAREVYEEAGLTGLEISPVVWVQHAVFDFGGYHFDQQERIHIARGAGGDIHPGALDGIEVDAFIGWQWVPFDQLAAVVADGSRIIPDWLPEQLPAVLAAGYPEVPIEMGLLTGR